MRKDFSINFNYRFYWCNEIKRGFLVVSSAEMEKVFCLSNKASTQERKWLNKCGQSSRVYSSVAWEIISNKHGKIQRKIQKESRKPIIFKVNEIVSKHNNAVWKSKQKMRDKKVLLIGSKSVDLFHWIRKDIGQQKKISPSAIWVLTMHNLKKRGKMVLRFWKMQSAKKLIKCRIWKRENRQEKTAKKTISKPNVCGLWTKQKIPINIHYYLAFSLTFKYYFFTKIPRVKDK